jgi:hypothetical protein
MAPVITIPTDIRNFLARYVPTVDHLDILILLHSDVGRRWSVSEVASALRVPQPIAQRALEHFETDDFLDVTTADAVRYRFNPASRQIADVTSRCADLYIWHREELRRLLDFT